MNQPNTDPTLHRYQQIVTVIGAGFHPDTPGADYTTLPEGITAQDVDDAVTDALEAGIDVHSVALETLHRATDTPRDTLP